MTYSIAARCDRTGAFGAAIATAMPAVGAFCIWTEASLGVVCTQSWTNPHLGTQSLQALSKGLDAQAAAEHVLAGDQNREDRQLGVIASQGDGFCYTGGSCTGWAGHLTGCNYTAQGNMLTGSEVVEALVAGFNSNTQEPLSERLLQSLEAAQAVGGDKRGRQSAALIVMQGGPFRHWDLRVDEHADPVSELRRVYEIAGHQLVPMIASRPDASGVSAPMADSVRDMILKDPPSRPGGGGSAQP